MGTPSELVARYVEDAQLALARELRGARQAQRLSQSELAGRLATRLTQQAVAGYETGSIVLSVPRLIEFCFALDLVPLAVLSRALKPLRTVLDLRALGAVSRIELAPLRGWARGNGASFVVFDAGVRDALSRLSGLTEVELELALAPALAQRPVG